MANEELTGHGYYTTIPLRILLNESLSAKARLLFGVIANLSNQRGYCYASNSYLAKVTGWHHKTVSGFVNELVKAGILTRFDEVTNSGLERRLFIAETPQRPETDTPPSVKSLRPPPSNDGTPSVKSLRPPPRNGYTPLRQMTAQNNYNIKIKDNTIANAEKIKTLGSGKNFILIQPRAPDSIKFRIHGEGGLQEFFEMNGSVLREPEQAKKFMFSNTGKPYNDFRHLFNDYKQFCQKQIS